MLPAEPIAILVARQEPRPPGYRLALPDTRVFRDLVAILVPKSQPLGKRALK